MAKKDKNGIGQPLNDAMADSFERLSKDAVMFQKDVIDKALNGDPKIFDGFGSLIDADIKDSVLAREFFADKPFDVKEYVQDFRIQLAALCSMYGFTFNLGVLHLNFSSGSSGSSVSFGETFASSIENLKEHFEQMKEKQSIN